MKERGHDQHVTCPSLFGDGRCLKAMTSLVDRLAVVLVALLLEEGEHLVDRLVGGTSAVAHSSILPSTFGGGPRTTTNRWALTFAISAVDGAEGSGSPSGVAGMRPESNKA